MVKCCSNHLRKKYGVLNNDGSARKNAWLTGLQENMNKVGQVKVEQWAKVEYR